MAGQITRLQVSGHRFLARRMRHALVRADARMLDDPLRAQSLSLTGGAVLGTVAVAICAALGAWRPADDVGRSPILMVAETGALYVTVDERVHPVPNLASARLITGTTDTPAAVTQRAIDRADHGPALGIPGAPAHLGPALEAHEAQWTVCDDEHGSTTVLAGAARDTAMRTGAGVLVAARGTPTATYLLHGGWRSRVDLRRPAVVRALGLDGVAQREVSPTLLAAVPEAPPIEPPPIPAAGTPGPPALDGLTVGTVFSVPGTDAVDHYVVLADGVQRVGAVTADLIRYSHARADHRIPVLGPDVLGAVPVRTTLAVQTFPDDAGTVASRYVCVRWRADGAAGTSHSTVLHGDGLSGAPQALALVQADGAGPAVDAVAIPSGRSIWVRSVGVTGTGQRTGSLFLVTDSGVVFGVDTTESAARLGLTGAAAPAPWPVLSALPRGPQLSRAAASVARDGAP
ncbi:type VII secretion protein EccB [Mycolicibacterium vaccae]|uniref:type VII secretion protein EccB n=1 Tax=Mycolicibacterium vaccae TaxID=1810 RepID=UPI003D02ECDE